jgi:uncharacterized membrane protein YczE
MLRRLVQLYIGLVLYGVSTALFVHANLGADPWDVFHLGVGKQFGLDFGTVIILTGAAVLLLWIPLRQMPGLGTVSNVIVLGLAANATLAVLPPMESLVLRSLMLIGAIVLNALATGMYIGAGFGPGPRDGLMTGLHARTGWSLRGSAPSLSYRCWRSAGRWAVPWRRNRALCADDWAAYPAVFTLVSPADGAQNGTATGEVVS